MEKRTGTGSKIDTLGQTLLHADSSRTSEQLHDVLNLTTHNKGQNSCTKCVNVVLYREIVLFEGVDSGI